MAPKYENLTWSIGAGAIELVESSNDEEYFRSLKVRMTYKYVGL